MCNATAQFLKQVHKDKFMIMKDSTSEANSKGKAYQRAGVEDIQYLNNKILPYRNTIKESREVMNTDA